MSWLRGSQAKLSTRISHDLVKEHRVWCFLLDILQWDSVLLMLTNSSKDSCSWGLEYMTLSQKMCISCQKMRILPLGNEKDTFILFFFIKQTSTLPEWRSNMGVPCLLIYFMVFLAASLKLFLLCIVLAFWQEAYFTASYRQSVHFHYKFRKPGYFWVYAAN